jgi:hypothetical protein
MSSDTQSLSFQEFSKKLENLEEGAASFTSLFPGDDISNEIEQRVINLVHFIESDINEYSDNQDALALHNYQKISLFLEKVFPNDKAKLITITAYKALGIDLGRMRFDTIEETKLPDPSDDQITVLKKGIDIFQELQRAGRCFIERDPRLGKHSRALSLKETQALNVFNLVLEKGNEERLEYYFNILQVPSSSSLAKAKALQEILNFLLLEKMITDLFLPFLDSFERISQSTISFGGGVEELKEELETLKKLSSKDSFSSQKEFWMLLNYHNFCSKDVKSLSEEEAKRTLEALKEINPEKFKFKALKQAYYKTLDQLTIKSYEETCSNSLDVISDFVSYKFGSFNFFQKRFSEGFNCFAIEDLVAPYGAILAFNIVSYLGLDLDKTDLFTSQNNLFAQGKTLFNEKIQKRQEEFYSFCFTKLTSLIGQAKRKGKGATVREFNSAGMNLLHKEPSLANPLPSSIAKESSSLDDISIEEIEEIEESKTEKIKKTESSSVKKKKKTGKSKSKKSKSSFPTSQTSPEEAPEARSSAYDSDEGLGEPLNEASASKNPSAYIPTSTIQESNFPYKLPNRVTRWFGTSFGSTLSQNKFSDYHECEKSYQKKMQAYHGFPRAADRFFEMGERLDYVHPKTGQKDLQYAIPAEITYEGTTDRGFVVYTIDSKSNRCYHRYFQPLTTSEILNKLKDKTFEELDSISEEDRSLEDSTDEEWSLSGKHNALNGCRIKKNELFKSVRITDPEEKIILTLFAI